MKIQFDYVDSMGLRSHSRVVEIDTIQTFDSGSTLVRGREILTQYRSFDVTRMSNVKTLED